MFDLVHVAGLDRKAHQPIPAVNAVKAVKAVKAKAKAKAAVSNAKTKATKTKVNKAAAAHEGIHPLRAKPLPGTTSPRHARRDRVLR